MVVNCLSRKAFFFFKLIIYNQLNDLLQFNKGKIKEIIIIIIIVIVIIKHCLQVLITN